MIPALDETIIAVHFMWACVVLLGVALVCSQWNVRALDLIRGTVGTALEQIMTLADRAMVQGDDLELLEEHRIRLHDDLAEALLELQQLRDQVDQHGTKLQELIGERAALERSHDALAAELAKCASAEDTKVELAKLQKRMGELELGAGIRPEPRRLNR